MGELDALFVNEKEAELGPEGHRERVRAMIEAAPDLNGIPDYVLLEYLLFYTIPRGDTKRIAKDLLRTFGSFSAVLNADANELQDVDGIGARSAHFLAHILAIVARAERDRFSKMLRIATAGDAAQYVYSRFFGQTKEMLLMISLNLNDEVIQTDKIADGAVDFMSVDLMKILRIADRNGAKKIILAHNHPGGTLCFSDADIDTTARVVECCLLTGLTFNDHLLMAGNRYVSMFGSDMMARVLERCDTRCSDFTMTIARERTRRNMLLKLKEDGVEQGSPLYKMQVLAAYKNLLSFGQSETDEFMREFIRDLPDGFEKEPESETV